MRRIEKTLLKGFDPPRANEDVTGIVARLARHARVSSSRALHKYLFGYVTNELAGRYPGGLQVLHRRFPAFWENPQEIAERHTIFPLFRFFEASVDHAQKIESRLVHARQNPGQHLRHRFELEKGDVWEKRSPMRYCVPCMIEDQQAGRMPTWYRQHQIPGVDWCVRHQSLLFDYCIECGQQLFKHSYVVPAFHCGCQRDIPALRTPEDAAKIKVSSTIAGPRNEDDRRDVRYCTFVVGLLEKNLQPLGDQGWLTVFRIGVKRKGLRVALKALGKVVPTHMAKMSLLLDTERYILRASSTGGLSVSDVAELSPKTKICLISALFDSVEEFVSALRSMRKVGYVHGGEC